MNTIEIRQETGAEHDRLGDRLRAVAADVAPLVEEVTGLSLPTGALLRMLPPDVWMSELARLRQSSLIRSVVREGSSDMDEFQRVRSAFVAHQEEHPHEWVLRGSHTVYPSTSAACPEIHLAPDAVQHAQFDEEQLYRLMALSITELAQIHTAGIYLLDRLHVPPQLCRGHSPRQVHGRPRRMGQRPYHQPVAGAHGGVEHCRRQRLLPPADPAVSDAAARKAGAV
ncbi:hypothetical protein ACFU99_11080 [Streptomyces sp. NPDC057654]|uniref:hypothetical protein n=1 Tax=Streptomyces sp. NPDC057654 TaxID=3346196 RepID=UPI00367EC2B6